MGVSALARYDDFMRNEFTTIIERDGKWFVAYCPEVCEWTGAHKGRGANKPYCSDCSEWPLNGGAKRQCAPAASSHRRFAARSSDQWIPDLRDFQQCPGITIRHKQERSSSTRGRTTPLLPIL